MDKDTLDQLLPPGVYRNLINGRITHDGPNEGSIKSLDGNAVINYTSSLAGRRIYGTYEDVRGDRMFFFLYGNLNSQIAGSIYYIDYTTSAITLVIESNSLPFFKPNGRNGDISHCSVIEDLLIFGDGVQMYMIDLKFDYNGNVNAHPDYTLLHRTPPDVRPIASAGFDANQGYNKIYLDNYQFAVRLVYKDRTRTPFSPLSQTVYGWKLPDLTQEDTINNYIDVQWNSAHFAALDMIEAIEHAFVKNNDSVYRIFNTTYLEDPDNDFPYTIRFTGNEDTTVVPLEVSAKIDEAIPIEAKAITVNENRVFVANIVQGTNARSGTYSLSITDDVADPVSEFTDYAKWNGAYRFGVVFHNKLRSSSVQAPTLYNVGPSGIASNFLTSKALTVTPTLTGVPSEWTHFSIVRTEELNFLWYEQYPVIPYFYIRDLTPSELERYLDDPALNVPLDLQDPQTPGGAVIVDNKAFRKIANTPAAADDEWTFIYLRVPMSIANIPDTETYVRIISPNVQGENPIPPGKSERVISFWNGCMVVNNFGVDDWAEFLGVTGGVPGFGLQVEVYKRAPARNVTVYHEISDRFPISASGGPIANAELDTFRIIRNDITSPPFYFTGLAEDLGNYYPGNEASMQVESPTPILYSQPVLQVIQRDGELDIVTSGAAGSAFQKGGSASRTIYSSDYSKLAKGEGRTFLWFSQEVVDRYECLIRWSNTFIPNTLLNGLGNFDFDNQYQLDVQRTPIRKLVALEDRLIVIHERETTSIPIGEDFLRTSDDQEFVTKTSGVLVNDRLLTGYGNFGTINPESVVEYDQKIYWWDAYSGSIVRYDNSGVFPISSYEMRDFFRQVSRDYFDPYTEVIGGIDPYHDEVWWSWRNETQTSLEPFTIVFSIRLNKWSFFTSHKALRYGRIGTRFFSFDGNHSLFEENRPEAQKNTFYFEEFDREVTIIANIEPGKMKEFTNVHLNQDIKNTDGYTEVIVRTENQNNFEEDEILSEEIVVQDDLFRAQIRRDEVTGNPIRGFTAEVIIRHAPGEQNRLRQANVVFFINEYSN